MTDKRRGPAIVTLPNDFDIVTAREFEAPIALVYEVLTKPEHVSKWLPPNGCVMTECSSDLRVGGKYHFVFRTADGIDCSFRGTYLELTPPTRVVDTWLFEGRPDMEAIETVDLHESDGVTTMTTTLTFRDKVSRDANTWQEGQVDGVNESLDNMEELLISLLDPTRGVS